MLKHSSAARSPASTLGRGIRRSAEGAPWPDATGPVDAACSRGSIPRRHHLSTLFVAARRDDNNWTFDGIDATGVRIPGRTARRASYQHELSPIRSLLPLLGGVGTARRPGASDFEEGTTGSP